MNEDIFTKILNTGYIVNSLIIIAFSLLILATKKIDRLKRVK